MHQHHERPACWKTEIPDGPGEACGNYTNPALAESSLRLTPGCAECARIARSMSFWEKTA